MRAQAGSTCERTTREQSMRERLMRSVGGDSCGRGFRSASVGLGFGGNLFLFCFFPPRDLVLSDLLSVVLVHNAGHVGAGFAKWRHSPILLDALRTSVVSGQRF